MKLGSLDGGEDVELNSVGFVEVSELFAMQNTHLVFGTILFNKEYTGPSCCKKFLITAVPSKTTTPGDAGQFIVMSCVCTRCVHFHVHFTLCTRSEREMNKEM